MTEDFRDQRQDAARSGRVRSLWMTTVAGLLWLASREHVAAIMRDAVHAIRLFRRRPAFTITTILTLTVGIGVTTAAFSIVQAVVLQQIPGPHSDRLVRVFEVNPQTGLAGSVSNANFVDWRDHVQSLDGLALYSSDTGTIRIDDGPATHLAGMTASDDFFRISGLSPLLGRTFVPEDFAAWHAAYAAKARAPEPTVMLLQERAWRRDFGSNPDIVGRVVLFNDEPVQVIGVVADHPLVHTFSTVNGPGAVDFWTPGGAWSGMVRRARARSAIGRIAPGVTLEQAQAELSTIASRLEAAYPKDNTGWTIRITPLRAAVAAGVQTQLWLLFGVALCVVLIGSLNVARLMATLNEGRRQEFQTRLAIGASRYELSRQAITESTLLSVAGGALGVLLAYVLLPAIVAMAPGDLPRLREIAVHQQTLWLALGLTVTIGLVSGLTSRVFSLQRLAVSQHVRHHGFGWWRTSLLAIQVSVALVLAVATGLLVRSMQRVEAQALGFVPDNVVAATIALPSTLTFGSLFDAGNHLLEAIERHPGVIDAALGPRPLGAGPGNVIRRADAPQQDVRAHVADVSLNYFSVIGASLRHGRTFTAADLAGSEPVAVLNARAAAELGLGDNAVGRSVSLDEVARLVVGVVAEVRQTIESDTTPAIYVPNSQSRSTWSGQLLVRTAGPPEEIVRDLRRIAGEHDARVALYRFQTMDDRVRELTASRRFLLQLVTTFSVLAIGLAVIGLAGVMAESVAQRVREIGIRMALGAHPGSIVSLMVRRGLRVVIVGAAIGLGIAHQLRGMLDGFVFGVPTTDTASYTAAGAALVIAGALACYLPARKAALVDPVTALRRE